ncbi:uncharacterized protein LY89DRAFT_750399 [Mollisia scopiformis]|uniref:2EXR domain-containing protein n=1 Tax=Mollisia scopiformis TaxID=149040 RepID=A0A194X4P4_MOLSC|nr:uncharacterized protein LY89DRAFT_750399 [Mollisia scopiformis]KUJ15140.1 hypothetical protein LY89DRAFT_750399 [Mollisia scopiformis]
MAQPSATTPLTTFTYFPRLAIELRQMIWKLTLQPRVVELEFGNIGFEDQDSLDSSFESYGGENDEDDRVELNSRKGFYTTTRNPIVMEVSRDSRNAVLHLYPKCFGSLWYPKCTRFNMAIDTLYIGSGLCKVVPLFFGILSKEERHGIQYLAFNRHDFDCNCLDLENILSGPGFLKRLKHVIEHMKSLREVLMVEPIECWFDTEIQGFGQWIVHSDPSFSNEISLHDTIPGIFDWLEWNLPNSTEFTKDWKVNQRVVLGWRNNIKFVLFPDNLEVLEKAQAISVAKPARLDDVRGNYYDSLISRMTTSLRVLGDRILTPH